MTNKKIQLAFLAIFSGILFYWGDRSWPVELVSEGGILIKITMLHFLLPWCGYLAYHIIKSRKTVDFLLPMIVILLMGIGHLYTFPDVYPSIGEGPTEQFVWMGIDITLTHFMIDYPFLALLQALAEVVNIVGYVMAGVGCLMFIFGVNRIDRYRSVKILSNGIVYFVFSYMGYYMIPFLVYFSFRKKSLYKQLLRLEYRLPLYGPEKS